MNSTNSPFLGETRNPYVFISYSHDSEEHRLRVLSLAQELRKSGFESHLDREEPAPAEGWIRWMRSQLKRADYVLAVCTRVYQRRAEGDEEAGVGQGANFEGLVISNELYGQDQVSEKYIPVVFHAHDRRFVPFFLAGRTTFNVADPAEYQRLCRVLDQQPDVVLPPPAERISRPPVAIPPLHVAPDAPADPVQPSPPPVAPAPVKALVGLAIDLSGSMAKNMPRTLGQNSTRLEAVRKSLERVAEEARDAAQRMEQEDRSTVALFAYGFGLRIGTVCDLLSLMQVAQGVISPREVEEVKREVEAEGRQKVAAYGELGRLAQRFLPQASRIAEDAARRFAESVVRSRLIARAWPRIEERLRHAGDTTIGIGELAHLWENSGETFENASELIFGNTPMREAFELLTARFGKERARLAPDIPSVLFLLSDGEPTDGSPMSQATELKRSGVTIVSCFVTDQDVISPRTLFTDRHASWTGGARLMFDIASPSEPGNPFISLLAKQGWTVPERARLFLQVNHSDVLEEFVRGLLGYVGGPEQLLPPRGR